MEDISRQLASQWLRNRVAELFDMLASLETVARFGGFAMINLVDDFLPVDYDAAPKVFSEPEKRAISELLSHVAAASRATVEDTHDIAWFRASKEWSRLADCATAGLAVFDARGRFSEETEDARLT